MEKLGMDHFKKKNAQRMKVLRLSQKLCISKGDALDRLLAHVNYAPPLASNSPPPTLPSTLVTPPQTGGYKHVPSNGQNEKIVTNKNAVLNHPFRMLVAGPSGSGKSTIVDKLIQHKDAMIDKSITEVMWFFSIEQSVSDIRDRNPHIQFFKGLPNLDQMERELDMSVNRLMVIDDQMSNKEASMVIQRLFTLMSHHMNISVVYIVQNLFTKSNPQMRDISVNANYIISFKNPREVNQISYLGRQLFSKKGEQFVTWAYEDATKNAHGYLLFNLAQGTKECERVMSNIFPGEENTYYVKAGSACDSSDFHMSPKENTVE